MWGYLCESCGLYGQFSQNRGLETPCPCGEEAVLVDEDGAETPEHSHSSAGECTEECPAFSPDGWACSKCQRQRPMAAETEDWDAPVCEVCFEPGEAAP